MADKRIKGRVVKLGDYVNTDVISPARWMREGLEVLRLHTMEAIRPDFYKDVKPRRYSRGRQKLRLRLPP